MFGHRFFGKRFFGARYFGDGGGTTVAHTTSGVLTAAGALLVGVATHTAIHDTSGVLTGSGASIVSSASRVSAGSVLHNTTGALVGAGSYISGAAARGIIYAIGQQARVSLETKWAVDTRQITFDFISQMVAGEALLSATSAVSVYSGVDLVNSLAFSGAVALTRTQAIQLIAGGVVGCTYKLTCRGLTTLGRQTFLNAFLVVL
jgi:hypothetical protein